MSALEGLRKFACLQALPDSELAVLAAVVNERKFAAGEALIEQGAPSRSCLFVVAGRTEVRKAVGESHRMVNTLGPGAILGQIGMVDGAPRSASVVAVRPTIALELARADYETLLESGRLVGLRLQEQLAIAGIRQLRTVTERLGLLLLAKKSAEKVTKLYERRAGWDIDVGDVRHVQLESRPTRLRDPS